MPNEDEVRRLWEVVGDIKRELEELTTSLREFTVGERYREENYRELKDAVKKLTETIIAHDQQISWVREQRENKNKLWIGLLTSSIIAAAGWFMWLYSLVGGKPK